MRHECRVEDVPDGSYGPAVTVCMELDLEYMRDYGQPNEKPGQLWVSNGEYDSQVNFCPFCGYEARVKIGDEALREELRETLRSMLIEDEGPQHACSPMLLEGSG